MYIYTYIYFVNIKPINEPMSIESCYISYHTIPFALVQGHVAYVPNILSSTFYDRLKLDLFLICFILKEFD